jgi:hypothetical protein
MSKSEKLCSGCGKIFEVHGLTSVWLDGKQGTEKVRKYFCPPCLRDALRTERNAARKVYDKGRREYFEKDCQMGICDRLKQHHAALKDDPERLPTEFMVKLICGEEGKGFYIQRKIEKELMAMIAPHPDARQ